MPDRFLHGNGYACPNCGGSGSVPLEGGWPIGAQRCCRPCRSTGRRGHASEDIVAEHVEEARQNYWPARAHWNAKGV